MLEKLLAINFALLILIQAWVVKVYVKTWIFPACLYGLFWFIYTIIPLLALPEADINPLSIAYILTTCLIFSLSSAVFKWAPAFRKNNNKIKKINYFSNFLKSTFFLFSILTIIATIINWNIQGISYYDIIFNLLDTSNQYLGKRYSEELSSNIFAQISITLTYPTAIIGGILYAAKDKSGSGIKYILLSVTSSLLMMIVEAAKGTLFLTLILFWSGILLSHINEGNFRLTTPGSIYKLTLWSLPILAATVFSFLARGIATDDQLSLITEKLYYYFASYSSGHLYAFSDWFTNSITGQSKISYDIIKDSNGFYSLMAIFNFIGTTRVAVPGVYEEYFYIHDILQTNIYTHYRGLILDFGLPGSLLVTFLAGLVAHTAYYQQLIRCWPAVTASFFSHFLGYVYTSFIISLLIWNSVFASFLILSVVLFTNNWLQRHKFSHQLNHLGNIGLHE